MTPDRRAHSTGFGEFVGPRLVGPVVAALVYFPLYAGGLVAAVPVWWFYTWLVVGSALTILTQWTLDDPRSTGHLHGRLAVQCASITGLIYLSGYGPGVALVYLKALVDNLRADTGKLLAASLAWIAVGIGAGQLGIAAGLVPSVIPTRDAHVLALISFAAIAFVAWLIADATARRVRTEAKLRRRERDISLLVTGIEGRAIFRLDPDGRVASWNRGAEQIKGYSAEEIIGRHFSCFYPPADVDEGVPERHLREARQEGPLEYEGWRVRDDGSRFWAAVVLTPLFEGGELVGFGKVTEDRTERARLEAELRRSETELREAQRLAHIGSWHWDVIEDEIVWSDELCRIYGISRQEIDFGDFLSRVHPGDRERVESTVRDALESGEAFRVEHRIVRPDREIRWLDGRGVCVVDEEGRVTAMRGTGHDITERKELQDELVQANKLRASAEMARGIAHDFGNFVMAIRNFAQVLEDGLPEGSEERESAARIADVADQTEKLVHQLRAFSREQELQPEILEVDELIREARPLLEKLLPEGTTLTLSLGASPARIRVDPSKLRQALMNLVINAGEAMPDGGEVVLVTAPVDDPVPPGIDGGRPPIPGVRISVRDTGIGMDEEIRSRVFEAFFTTKGSDGTGLGLSTVYGFVSQSGGTIDVLSEPGQGSTFHCCFPRARKAVGASSAGA